MNRALAVLLPAAVAVLVLATSAAAERPGWWSIPEIKGGPAEVGGTLLASDGSLNCTPTCGPNGPEPDRSGTRFEWVSCTGTSGGGADRPTGGLEHDPRPAGGCVVRKGLAKDATSYVVQPDDAGRHIQLHVMATNWDCGEVRSDDGSQACAYSSGHGYSKTVGPIGGSNVIAPTSTALPAVSGLAKDGQTLAVSNGSWTGQPSGFVHEWRRCAAAGSPCAAIAGATASSYTLRPEDVGSRMQVAVTATNPKGSTSAVSALTDVVAAIEPANTALPAIDGIVEDLQTLTATPGSWTGTPPFTYAYQWLRCSTKLRGCASIEGATEESYRVVRDDLGARILVTVTATNRGGSGKATSPRTTHVVGARPRPGSEVLAVSEIVAPNRLRISVVQRSPTVVRVGGRLVLTVSVTDRRGFLIEGARVQLTGSRGRGVLTNETGTAAVRLRAGLFPGRFVVTLTATKPGDTSISGTKNVAVSVRG